MTLVHSLVHCNLRIIMYYVLFISERTKTQSQILYDLQLNLADIRNGQFIDYGDFQPTGNYSRFYNINVADVSNVTTLRTAVLNNISIFYNQNTSMINFIGPAGQQTTGILAKVNSSYFALYFISLYMGTPVFTRYNNGSWS